MSFTGMLGGKLGFCLILQSMKKKNRRKTVVFPGKDCE